MDKRIDLTQGGILEKIVKLSLPIMGTSFIQMAYSMVDMIWVGKDGSNSLAAVGTAGFYPWLAMAFILISRIGGEIKVAQSIGRNNIVETKKYIKASIEINIILAILYTIVMLAFNKELIGLFKLEDQEVTLMARQYLIIVSIGMIFYFINPVFTGIFNGLGNSKTPFKINTIGLVVNIILDPILIFGMGPIPRMGVMGAALATVFAQVVVTVLFIKIIKDNKEDIFFRVKLFRDIETKYYKVLFQLGLPVAIQSGLFTIFSMWVGVIVASFGAIAVAVQKVGSQIESITWMSTDGMASALSTFMGQNYGAKKYDRINKGCKVGLITALLWGTFTTLVLILFSKEIFSVFTNESEVILQGSDYLKILGYSQLFMCFEIIISGIFRGIGRTYIPSAILIIFNGFRIPLAYILSKPQILGIDGVWWSISISTMIKGVLLLSIFSVLYKMRKLYIKE